MATLGWEGHFRSSGQGPSHSLGVRQDLLEEMKLEPKPETKNVGRSGGVVEGGCCLPRKNIPERTEKFYRAHNRAERNSEGV